METVCSISGFATGGGSDEQPATAHVSDLTTNHMLPQTDLLRCLSPNLTRLPITTMKYYLAASNVLKVTLFVSNCSVPFL